MVVLIGGLVLAIGIPVVEQYIEKARIVEAVVEIGDMSKKLKEIERTTGVLPNTLADAGLAGKSDRWGRPYAYLNLRTMFGGGLPRRDKSLRPLNSDFDLYSVGRDGVTHASLLNAKSRDDIVRARDGSFVGTAQEFDP